MLLVAACVLTLAACGTDKPEPESTEQTTPEQTEPVTEETTKEIFVPDFNPDDIIWELGSYDHNGVDTFGVTYTNNSPYTVTRVEVRFELKEELTEEEIRAQLMRKAEFKQELRDVVKEIDTLRSRRERFTSELKVCRTLMIVGLVFIAAAALVIILFGNNEEVTYRFVIAAALAGLGVFTLILSEVKKNSVKKQQKKHEQTIEEKKEKRDILIGRLNKINKRLHIHDGDESSHSN